MELTVAQVLVTYLSKYATRHQGPVLKQLQHPSEADTTVNDAFRPVSKFFDRITRPEQLLTALPAAVRALTDQVHTGAVVVSLPQDVQSHAYDWPAAFFAERDWVARRPVPDADEVAGVAWPLAAARRPLIIAGGGLIYSGATAELEAFAEAAGIPGGNLRRQGRGERPAWWQLGGIGLEGTPATNELAGDADLVPTVGSRLTDFATASQSLCRNPDVRFASINVDVRDADRLGATGIVADAKRALAPLAEAVRAAGTTTPPEWQQRVRETVDRWEPVRAAALDPDTPFDRSTVVGDVVPDTGAVLTQGQLIGLLQEHAQSDGTFLMAPTELVTVAQERLPVTVVVPENHGYQVIHRLRMGRSGREFGNEFRCRTTPSTWAAGSRPGCTASRRRRETAVAVHRCRRPGSRLDRRSLRDVRRRTPPAPH